MLTDEQEKSVFSGVRMRAQQLLDLAIREWDKMSDLGRRATVEEIAWKLLDTVRDYSELKG
jgi:hypothetical protein